MRLLLAMLTALSLHGQAIVTNKWTAISPTGNQGGKFVGWEALAFDPGTKRICGMYLYREISSEPNMSWTCYSIKYNDFIMVSNGSHFHNAYTPEGGHPLTGQGIDSNGVLYGFGNFSGGQVAERPEMTYWFDFVGQVGRMKQPISGSSNKPWYSIQLATGVWDSAHSVFITQGGDSGFTGFSEYTPSTNTWATGTACTAVAANCPTPGNLEGASAFRTVDNKMYLFGGYGGASYTATSGSWSGGTETLTIGSHSIPSGGVLALSGQLFNCWGNSDGIVTLTSVTATTISYAKASNPGACSGSLVSLNSDNPGANALFKYDQTTHTSVAISPSGTKPHGRVKAVFVYDSTNDVFILYGGSNTYPAQSVGTDTWIYDPVANSWTQQTPTQNPSGATSPLFWRGTYDPLENAVVIADINLAGTNWWIYRYAGSGLGNVGRSSPPAYSPSTGLLNINQGSWAQSPSVSTDGTNVITAWTETGSPSLTGNGQWMLGYAQTTTILGSASQLGTGPNAIFNEYAQEQGDDLAIAYVGGSPYVCGHEGNNNASSLDLVVGKKWTGSAWSGSFIGLQGGTAGANQGNCAIADINSVPYMAVKEFVPASVPRAVKLFVVKSTNNAASWTVVGSALNRTGNGTDITEADTLSITNDGSNHACAAWTEYNTTIASNAVSDSAAQTFLSCNLSGTTWTAQGGAANVNVANSDYGASVVYISGVPYVTFTERTNSGPAQVFVRKLVGGVWSTVGSGSRNKDLTTGWAFWPKLATDGTNLYLTWDEQQALGQHPQVYVDKWNGSAWSSLGGSLNQDPTNGSATHPSITFVDRPVVAYQEVKFGSYASIYQSEWSGSVWTGLPAPVCTITTTTLADGTIGHAYSQTVTTANCNAPTFSVTVGSLPTGLSLDPSTGTISGTPTLLATTSFTIGVTDTNGNPTQALSIQVKDPAFGPTVVKGISGTGYVVK